MFQDALKIVLFLWLGPVVKRWRGRRKGVEWKKTSKKEEREIKEMGWQTLVKAGDPV